ncbi:MAG: hypothetical protein ACPGU7_00640 [Gammaproteobacteria bacterium]
MSISPRPHRPLPQTFVSPWALVLALGVLGPLAGCVSNPHQGASAPVEERSRIGQARAATTGRTAEVSTSSSPSYRPKPAPAPKATPVVRAAPAIRPRSAKPIGPTGSNPPVSAPRTTSARAGSPAAALLNQADAEADPGRRAAILERALRIAPEDPRVWSDLAQTRLDQRRFDQAEALALKSNALAGGQPTLWPRNWLIVAKARLAMGDDAGAREAEDNSNRGVR